MFAYCLTSCTETRQSLVQQATYLLILSYPRRRTCTNSHTRNVNFFSRYSHNSHGSPSLNMDPSIPNLLGLQGVEIKAPLDPDWEFYSSTYNRRVPVTPRIVILPATVEQAAQAIRWAAACGLKVQARSGGHSYASHSNGGVDGSVVVDLRKLQDINISGDGIVRVGGGVRLGNLACAIWRDGRALAHGTCPTVSIGGHFTHGGFGFTSRTWGLSMDQIVRLDVVMANGQVVQASESENSDLFVVSCLFYRLFLAECSFPS